MICSPIQKAIRKRKGIERKHPFRKWNYAMSGILTILFLDFIVLFFRMNSGVVSGDFGSAASYMVQSGIIAVMVVVLILCLVLGMFQWYKKGIADTKVEKEKYCITAFLSICMLVAVVVFDMYQFWAI